MSPQCRKLRESSSKLGSSASWKLSSVSSLKTTPNPYASPGRLRSKYSYLLIGTPLLEQRRQIEPRWASAKNENVERT